MFTRLGSLRSTFTYRQLLNFVCLVIIYRTRHAITKSDTNYSLRLVLALLCIFVFVTWLPAGLVAASCVTSSWAARSARAASNTQCPPRNYGWQTWFTGWAEADEEPKSKLPLTSVIIVTLELCHGCLCVPPARSRPLTFLHETLRRRSASLLFWVKFICPAEDSSSCAMVVMCTGTSFAFCSSAAYTHRSTSRFFFANGVLFCPMSWSYGDCVHCNRFYGA